MNADTVFGLYAYCADYHNGQTSRLYRIMSRLELRYRPRLSDSAWEAIAMGTGPARDEWDAAREVYCALRDRMAQ